MVENHTERKHALLSASGASRWLNCTPSARIAEQFEESETSVFAAEGTLAHEFGDLALTKYLKKITPKVHKVRLKELRAHELYTDEMEEQTQKYVDYCLQEFKAAKRKTKGAVMSVEERVDLTDFIEAGFGTNDCMIIADGVLEVIDLKYGKGVKVSAVDNPQLKLYGLGALVANELLYDIHTVRLTIVQPRLDNISSWDITAEALIAWGNNAVKPKAVQAYAGEGLQAAGDWCRWCPAKPRCAAIAAKNLEVAQHEFKEPHFLTDTQLVEVHKQMGLLADWVNSVRAYMLTEAIGGRKFEGFKLVAGKSSRKWSNEDAVLKRLSEQNFVYEGYTNTKLKGIGDIEKFLTKSEFPKIVGEFVIKPEGKPTLVSVSDKRKELNLGAATDFAEDSESLM